MASKIDMACNMAEIETGVRNAIPLCSAPPKKRGRRWTDGEKEYIRENYKLLTYEQMAKQLRRTPTGIKIYISRILHLSKISRLKADDILTAEQVANGLGCDSKTVHLLMDSGRMPYRRFQGNRLIRIVDRYVFLRWMLNPENWLYFNVGRVGKLSRKCNRGPSKYYDFAFWADAERLIDKARRKWKDNWLTPGQVARRLHDANGTRYVNKTILASNLKAKRWGNWRIKESELPPKGMTINFRGEIVKKKL